ncbi:MAG: hypothetical protein WKG07_40955 [Hymenobacter sp.]
MARTLLLTRAGHRHSSGIGAHGRRVFLFPAFTLAQFGVAFTAGRRPSFWAYLTGWFLLFVTLAAGLAWAWVRQRHAGAAGLCYLLGGWWIGIGIGIFLAFGKPDNLLLDTLEGLLIVVLTWRGQRGRGGWLLIDSLSLP